MLTSGLAAFPATESQVAPASIPAWLARYSRTSAPLERYHRRVRATATTAVACGAAFLLGWMLWIGMTNASPRIADVPIAALVLLVAGVFAWLVRVGSQWPHLRERRAARRLGVRVFALGTFPLSRTYLVVSSSGLSILRGRTAPIGRVAWADVDVLAATTSRVGVGVSLSIDGEWHDLPIVLEVGGPSASAYSWPPLGAQKRLLNAVVSAIEPKAQVFVDSR